MFDEVFDRASKEAQARHDVDLVTLMNGSHEMLILMAEEDDRDE